ncbi:MAG: phosphonate metabolism protein/1,5-bisphosphokinase (PRPP-forming) PhnN, partial [Alphaproteobacteria bacterium]|nr:phosphonate metabolism protein/1,5-bisphosphokinase (PRPP-forming) PhnN [Alphaproteobacteria bacterium]
MQGRMIAIVGPSGVGKDTVMAALQKSRPDLSLVKRHITRSPESIGEDHYALSSEEFSKAVDQQKFVLSWTAHGLLYGVSHEAIQKLCRGQDMLINLSRNMLEEADDVFDRLIVINLTAPKDVLLSRLE